MDRSSYQYFLAITTRWKDNDVYGHVNNVEYYSFFDTVINDFLIRSGGLDIHGGGAIGLCVESQCTFKQSLAFPGTVDAGLRVAKLGNSSVGYEIGLFRAGSAAPPGRRSPDDRARSRPARDGPPGPVRRLAAAADRGDRGGAARTGGTAGPGPGRRAVPLGSLGDRRVTAPGDADAARTRGDGRGGAVPGTGFLGR